MKFLLNAVQMERMDQVIMMQQRKSEGLIRVINMLEGTPVMTYPTKRMDTQVWY